VQHKTGNTVHEHNGNTTGYQADPDAEYLITGLTTMSKTLAILLLSVFILCGCRQQEAVISPSGNVVRIGVIAPMSGPDKQSGENALLGVRTALQLQPYLNNGDKVELLVENNQGTPEQTLMALEKLHGQEDVAGVLLMAKSNIVLAAVPVADQFQIPILALIATHPDITKNNRFISQLVFDDSIQGTVAALYVRDEMLINRVAVFSDPNNAHYSYLADEFIGKYTSVGGELIEHVIDGTETADLTNILARLQDRDVQLLYLAVAPERVIQLARAAAEIGWKPRMMGSDGLMTKILLQYMEDKELVEGMLATDFYSNVLPKNEYSTKVLRMFNKLFAEQGTTYTALGCEGTSILLHAMDRCDNKTNRSCVNYMLRNTEEFDGLLGKIAIRDNGKAERPILVNVIEDQKMKFLVKVY